MASYRKKFLSFLLFPLALGAGLTSSANAQIQMEALRPADNYDVGTLTSGQGGLDSSLWQGTSAQRATSLVDQITAKSPGPALDLVRAALLSGGVPPQSQDNIERSQYTASRLRAMLTIGDLQSFSSISKQANLKPNNPSYIKVFTDSALLSGEIDKACEIADGVKSERKTPYWAKLRAFCHVARDELPAAELTADLLRRSKHKDKIFFTLLSALAKQDVELPKGNVLTSPLYTAMTRRAMKTKEIDAKFLPPALAAKIAMDSEKDIKPRFAAMLSGASFLSPEQFIQILGNLADTPLLNLDDINSEKTWDAKSWGQAYQSLKTSRDMEENAVVLSAILRQAQKRGVFNSAASALAQDIRIVPHHLQAGSKSPLLFARIAVRDRDLGALRSLFLELPEESPARGRIALASDAIGNGFVLGDLGVDINARLSLKGSQYSRAIRDTYIASALGANLSSAAIKAMQSKHSLGGSPARAGQLLILQDAGRRRAQAEIALQAANIIGNEPLSSLRADSLARIISALHSAGMTDLAGQLAAQDFLSK